MVNIVELGYDGDLSMAEIISAAKGDDLQEPDEKEGE